MTNEQNFKSGSVKTWQLLQYVTAPVYGTIDNWPANIQDQVYAAMERLCAAVQLPLCIIDSGCDIDHGEAADKSDDKYFVRVIVSEIVAMDKGYEKRVIEEALKTIH